MSMPNVLHVNAAAERKAYRSAVANIIRAIQAAHDETDIATAERLDVSVGTISNARNQNNDLSAVYLQRIGKVYGCDAVDPFMAMFAARGVPIESKCDSDALPSLTAAVHSIAQARSPRSHGGVVETPKELLDMLPELRDAQRAITALISRAERLAA